MVRLHAVALCVSDVARWNGSGDSDARRDFNELSRFEKQLRFAGVTEAMLHTVQVDDRRRLLAFVSKSA